MLQGGKACIVVVMEYCDMDTLLNIGLRHELNKELRCRAARPALWWSWSTATWTPCCAP